MNTQDFNEISGRIDGVAQALLLLAARLERNEVIDGPLYCERLRAARSESDDAAIQASRRTLMQLADELQDARSHRRSRDH